MELLFTSDLHGSRKHYQALLDLLRQRPCDVLILGGDMLPDGDRGMPYRSVTHYVRGEFKDFLQKAHEIVPHLQILVVFGNHDWVFSVDEIAVLEEQKLLMVLGHKRLVQIGSWTFLGLSFTPPAPYWIKDFERRDMKDDAPSDFCGYIWSTEKKWIMPVMGHDYFTSNRSLEEMLAEAPVCPDPWILVSHAPPDHCNLDTLPGELQVGSRAVRKFIQERRPRLSLHGHIHESPRESGHISEKIGHCLCVNPGQELESLCAVRWNSDRLDQAEHSLGYKM